MAREDSLVRFEAVSFEYGANRPILDEATFALREGRKIAIMGQNGAGKSTILSLITGKNEPESGKILIRNGTTIALSSQVIPREKMDMTVLAFFESFFPSKVYDIEPKIKNALEVVHFSAPLDRIIRSFSGGQQARLLLASALIQDPDLLLLDEPTNNLDHDGIEHLTDFLKHYPKTFVVISHDAEFLNSFTDGVLYLDIHTRNVEQYDGTYNDVQTDIAARIERENRKNAQLAKEIQENKDKMNFFAQKGGKMRVVAKKMRTKVEEMEEEKVDVRKEDKTIRPFTIPSQPELTGVLLALSEVKVIKNHKPTKKKVTVSLKKNMHLRLAGPNGIGKSTLLESLARGTEEGAIIGAGVTVGLHRQDFSTLNFDHTVYQALDSVMKKRDEERLRAVAAGFLLLANTMQSKVGTLSEGQKGLVAFAQLVLLSPGLLILDEPTNHINFRHLPVIAKALDQYQGAMILVSHVPEFVEQIRIDEVLELG